MTIAIEVGIALVSLIIGAAISDQQQRNQNALASHETYIRHLFQAIKDRFGITYDQLNQALDKLGLKLSQLTEATRGSARLSRASKIFREFLEQYPDKVNEINNKKNQIQNLINRISAQEEAAASKIQSGGKTAYSASDALNDAINLVMQGNEIIGEPEQQIDTSLYEEEKARKDLLEQQHREKTLEHIRDTIS